MAKKSTKKPKKKPLGQRLEEHLQRAQPTPRIPTLDHEPTGPEDRGWTREDVYRRGKPPAPVKSLDEREAKEGLGTKLRELAAKARASQQVPSPEEGGPVPGIGPRGRGWESDDIFERSKPPVDNEE